MLRLLSWPFHVKSQEVANLLDWCWRGKFSVFTGSSSFTKRRGRSIYDLTVNQTSSISCEKRIRKKSFGKTSYRDHRKRKNLLMTSWWATQQRLLLKALNAEGFPSSYRLVIGNGCHYISMIDVILTGGQNVDPNFWWTKTIDRWYHLQRDIFELPSIKEASNSKSRFSLSVVGLSSLTLLWVNFYQDIKDHWQDFRRVHNSTVGDRIQFFEKSMEKSPYQLLPPPEH